MKSASFATSASPSDPSVQTSTSSPASACRYSVADVPLTLTTRISSPPVTLTGPPNDWNTSSLPRLVPAAGSGTGAYVRW